MLRDDRTVIFRSDRPGSRQELPRRVSTPMDTAPLNTTYSSPHHAFLFLAGRDCFVDRDGSWGISPISLSLSSHHAAGPARGPELHARNGRQARGQHHRSRARADHAVARPALDRDLDPERSPGPVVFRQRRCGRHGRPFQIWKFRTMYRDAEARVHELEARNQAAGGVLFKIHDDPRITKVGAILRRTHLDELPQLVNVLKGEMSLVGPRPFQVRDSERLQKLDPVAFVRRLEFPPGVPAPGKSAGPTRSTPKTSSTSTWITSRTGRSAATSCSSPARWEWCSPRWRTRS